MYCQSVRNQKGANLKIKEVTSNSDIVEEEYEQEEDENIEGHEAAGQQEVHLQRIPEIFHQSRQSQP